MSLHKLSATHSTKIIRICAFTEKKKEEKNTILYNYFSLYLFIYFMKIEWIKNGKYFVLDIFDSYSFWKVELVRTGIIINRQELLLYKY